MYKKEKTMKAMEEVRTYAPMSLQDPAERGAAIPLSGIASSKTPRDDRVNVDTLRKS